ncbi:MAG: hypothetical protein KAG53_11140 [Endozoicomonadaceae bacterium]|nr:hypothetical protein [Endozoicomonadaceae bacterium]
MAIAETQKSYVVKATYSKDISDYMVIKDTDTDTDTEKTEYTEMHLIKHIEQFHPHFDPRFTIDKSKPCYRSNHKKFIVSFIKKNKKFKENDISKVFEIFKRTKKYALIRSRQMMPWSSSHLNHF